MAAADALGYPVVLKAVGPAIVHRTDVGGVKLGLGDPAAVAAAYRELSSRLKEGMTGALLQKMVRGGVEVMVGVSQDAIFGPLIAYGSGGTLVELMADVAFRLHPLTDRCAGSAAPRGPTKRRSPTSSFASPRSSRHAPRCAKWI